MTTNAQHQELDRIFGNLPLYEATHQLHIIPSYKDKKGAKRLDPWNCVLSKACQRLFGSTAAAFFGYFAYVDREWRGKRILERFVVPKKTRGAIDEFDKTKIFPVGGFILLPPSPSATLDARRQRSADRRALPKTETGTTSFSVRKNPVTPSVIIKRNGHGSVHTHISHT
jgi:hypothetical protein